MKLRIGGSLRTGRLFLLSDMNDSGNNAAKPQLKRTLLRTSVALLLVLTAFGIATAPGFLAVNRPTGGGILVVEGWIPRDNMAEAAQVFRKGRYQRLVVVGGPVDAPTEDYPFASYADRGETELRYVGINPDEVVVIRVPDSRNRTFASAVAARRWLERANLPVNSLDVLTVGVHARKSLVFFQYACAPRYKVGVIALPEHSYDSRHWILSAAGLKIVSRNTVGYAYSVLTVFIDEHGYEILKRE